MLKMIATNDTKHRNYIGGMKKFPQVIDGKIDVVHFLEASKDLITLVERLGTVFAPVKYDIQGNVDKIRKCFETQQNVCLLDLMSVEKTKCQLVATEGILWLNRTLLFFSILFQQIINHIKSNNYKISMAKLFSVAYEGSVKKYHNWVSQKLFALICKMTPALPQLMDILEVNGDLNCFSADLMALNESLLPVIHAINLYFQHNKLCIDNK